MPGLFSRRPKAKGPAQLGDGKGYLGAVSSADIDRLGLSSPTPSTADAPVLHSVPTKDDLPAPPPKDTRNESTLRSTLMGTSIDRQTSRSSTAQMNEFGQMHGSAVKSATVGLSSYNVDKSYSQSGSAYTLNSARRPAPSTNGLHTVSSRSHLTVPFAFGSSSYDAALACGPIAAMKPYSYGYTTEGWHLQLESARVSALLEACGEQIRSRGLDSPLIFSSMALDLSPTNVASLIKPLLATNAGQRTLPKPFLDDIRYANPHDLAAVIKWAFARMGRVLAVPVPIAGAKKGEVREEMVYVQQRGFFDLEAYNAWREQERGQHYPATAFNDFLAHLAPENARLLSSLFSLLSSAASYSLKNGMMPAKLAKHFGALLFGLPEDETFARTYDAYVRASNATEHLLLAYIRCQAAKTALPPRLAQHVSGYPSMLSTEITMPSASSKLVPITQIERVVRLYSPDLVQTACEMDLVDPCPEWQDCKDSNEALGKDPQLSDKFRKLINLRGGATQGRKFGAASARNTPNDEDDAVAAHFSLADKRWDDFLSDGFAAPDSSKLAFDLNESAKRNRAAKRETVQWNDFFQAGFDTGDSTALDAVLSFDDTLKNDVQNWPAERDQLHAKLKSRQEKLPPFNYDTQPRLIASPTLAGLPEGKLDNHPISRMDETFADVWADYLLGSGWSNRDELTHRNANFAVVQYKSRPNKSTVGSQSAGSSLSAPTRLRMDESVGRDERVDAAWFIVQEVVPAQYRADLEAMGRGTSKGRAMIRKLTMFRSRKDKERSNVPVAAPANGNVGQEKSLDNNEDVFRPGPGGQTKRIMLSDQLRRNGSKNGSRSSLRASTDRERPGSAAKVRADDEESPAHPINNGHAQFRSEGGGSKLMSSLRAKSMKVVKSARRGASSPALNAQMDEFGATPSAAPPANGRPKQQEGDTHVDRSFTSADYETRSITSGDDVSVSSASEIKPGQNQSRATGGKRQQRGEEAWIDILVRANGTRMTGQDAPAPALAGAHTGSLGLPTSKADATAMAESGSAETFSGDGGPRSSTPPLTASAKTTPEMQHVEDLGLSRISSRSSSVGEPDTGVLADTTGRTANLSADIPMRDASLRDASYASHASSQTTADAPTLKPVPALDPVAAARAALKSRKEAPARAPAQIDTKKLVESLRAGLSPIEAVRASKDVRSQSPASPVELRKVEKEEREVVKPRGWRDPFAKDPVAGRVADVASRFGGRAAAPAPSAATVGGLGGGASQAKEKPLPRPQVPLKKEEVVGETSTSGYVLEATPSSTPSPAAIIIGGGGGGGVSSTMARTSTESELEEIYPEDAASNIDPREHYQSADSPLLGGARHLQLPSGDQEAGGDMEQLNGASYVARWRGQKMGADGEGEEEGEMPSRFAMPYQPGMPLDNVLEESESVLSGSTNLY